MKSTRFCSSVPYWVDRAPASFCGRRGADVGLGILQRGQEPLDDHRVAQALPAIALAATTRTRLSASFESSKNASRSSAGSWLYVSTDCATASRTSASGSRRRTPRADRTGGDSLRETTSILARAIRDARSASRAADG